MEKTTSLRIWVHARLKIFELETFQNESRYSEFQAKGDRHADDKVDTIEIRFVAVVRGCDDPPPHLPKGPLLATK